MQTQAHKLEPNRWYAVIWFIVIVFFLFFSHILWAKDSLGFSAFCFSKRMNFRAYFGWHSSKSVTLDQHCWPCDRPPHSSSIEQNRIELNRSTLLQTNSWLMLYYLGPCASSQQHQFGTQNTHNAARSFARLLVRSLIRSLYAHFVTGCLCIYFPQWICCIKSENNYLALPSPSFCFTLVSVDAKCLLLCGILFISYCRWTMNRKWKSEDKNVHSVSQKRKQKKKHVIYTIISRQTYTNC